MRGPAPWWNYEFRWPAEVVSERKDEYGGRIAVRRDRDGAIFYLKPVEFPEVRPSIGLRGEMVERSNQTKTTITFEVPDE